MLDNAAPAEKLRMQEADTLGMSEKGAPKVSDVQIFHTTRFCVGQVSLEFVLYTKTEFSVSKNYIFGEK